MCFSSLLLSVSHIPCCAFAALLLTAHRRYVANIQIIQGQVEGRTRLPLPPDSAVLEVQEPSLSFEDRVFMDTEGEEAIANRDRIYVLEGAIITWTKQIRKVPWNACCYNYSQSFLTCNPWPRHSLSRCFNNIFVLIFTILMPCVGGVHLGDGSGSSGRAHEEQPRAIGRD